MYRRILVATDLSPASSQFMRCLHGLLPLGVEEVILFHALGLRHLDSLRHLLARAVEPELLRQQQMLKDEGFENVEVLVAPGTPAWEITRAAKEREISLLVIGSHGTTLARQVLLGSVALEVLQGTEVPVFLANLRILDSTEPRCEMICGDFRESILHPTDFSDTAERAFQHLVRIVDVGATRVTLLHVQDRSRISPHLEARIDEFNRIDLDRLKRRRSELERHGAEDVRIEIAYGAPIREILRCLEQGQFSMVVMGTQGRGFFGELFLGSVSHQVARRSLLPILFVPALKGTSS